MIRTLGAFFHVILAMTCLVCGDAGRALSAPQRSGCPMIADVHRSSAAAIIYVVECRGVLPRLHDRVDPLFVLVESSKRATDDRPARATSDTSEATGSSQKAFERLPETGIARKEKSIEPATADLTVPACEGQPVGCDGTGGSHVGQTPPLLVGKK